MKNLFIFGMAILLFAGLVTMACEGNGERNEEALSVIQIDDENKQEDQEEGMAFVEIETDDLIETRLIVTSVDVSLIRIELKHTDENVVFECTVDLGGFSDLTGIAVSKNVIVAPGVIHWRPMEPEAYGIRAIIEQAFIEFILKDNNHIVGYAVVEILQNIIPVFHSGKVLKSALFPKVDGEYQIITEEYVKTEIEKIKGKAIGGS